MQAEQEPSTSTHKNLMTFVFLNCIEENAAYTITVRDIVKSQAKNKTLEQLTQLDHYKPQKVEKFNFSAKTSNLLSQRNYNMCCRMVPPPLATSG